MKTIKLILISMVFLMAISCDDYLDINDDPNNPTSVDNKLILSSAQKSSGDSQALSGRQGDNGAFYQPTITLGNLFMQNWTVAAGYSWYDEEMDYAVNSSFMPRIWNNIYRNQLKQYHLLDNAAANNEHYQAIAKIMKSYHFQILVDIYGDIPYTEALQRGDNPTPKFDNAENIYTNLIVVLDDAIALIKAGNTNAKVNIVENDQMFSGDMTNWIKFANTLKLRILARQSSLASKQTYISTEITKINNEGSGFIDSDVTLNMGYIKEEDKQSPFWETFGESVAGGTQSNYKATSATSYVISMLTDFNDARIDFIYKAPLGGVHRGLVQGDIPAPEDVIETVSAIGTGLRKSPEQDVILFSLAESNFVKAELALLVPSLGNPQDFYEAGISASYATLGAESAPSYYAQPKNLVGWTFSANKLEAIITQKWIALNGIDPIQSWFDYTRTGYPSTLPISTSASGPNIPVRLAYSSTEIDSNPNVPAQPNIFSDKIFWAN